MKNDRRFVFDTNVLVSAFFFFKSTPFRALELASSIGMVVCSDETMDELREVIVRPKFDKFLPLDRRISLLNDFEKLAIHFPVPTQITLCRDPKDDKYLSLALAAQAECITSGDQDLLVLADTFPVPILNPAQFLVQKTSEKL